MTEERKKLKITFRVEKDCSVYCHFGRGLQELKAGTLLYYNQQSHVPGGNWLLSLEEYDPFNFIYITN